MGKSFKDLYNIAVSSKTSDSISPFISTGEIICVVLSENDNVYKGINIIEDNQLKVSAEESAISSLLSEGDKKIKKMVIVNALGEVIKPSNSTYDTILDLSDNLEVLINANPLEYKKIEELLPDYYGTFRINTWFILAKYYIICYNHNCFKEENPLDVYIYDFLVSNIL